MHNTEFENTLKSIAKMGDSQKSGMVITMMGLPATGKSTIAEYIRGANLGFTIISKDNKMMLAARALGVSYNELYSNCGKPFENYLADLCMNQFRYSLYRSYSVIWDQTNLKANKRREINKETPDYMKKICVYVVCGSEEEHDRRLNNRPGKEIPDFIMNSMRASVEPPIYKEGFDEIYVIDTYNKTVEYI